MTDNTQVATGAGDTVRDIDRSANPVAISAKTQVVQLDAGGQSGESLVSANNPLPMRDPGNALAANMAYKQALVAQGGTNGFVPVEIPGFLFG